MKKIKQFLVLVLLCNLTLYPSYLVHAKTDDIIEATTGAAAGYVAWGAVQMGLGPTLAVLGPVGWGIGVGLIAASLIDGDFFGFGNDKPKNAQEAIEKCVKRPPKSGEISKIETEAQKQGMSQQQTADAICGSPESMNHSEGPLAEDALPLIEEFLWDPISEGNGKVLVLLPASYKGKTIAVGLFKDGVLVERGFFTGDYHNGSRPHFRFLKEGREYGSNIEIIAATTQGDCSWIVPNGSQQYKGTSCNAKRPGLDENGQSVSIGAQCEVSKNNITQGEVVTLKAKTSSGDTASEYTYAWSGNGINRTGSTLKLSYDEIGKYIVNLSVTNKESATETVICPEITVVESTELTAECKVSDTTPAIDDEIDIWVEIEGGVEPYTVKWSGDDSKLDDFDDESPDNTVETDRKGSYKLKVSVEDAAGEEVRDTCTTIKVTEDGEEDDVIVRVTDNSIVSTTNTTPTTNTSVTSIYPYYRDLTVGASGPDVTALQQYLAGRGYLVMPAGVAYGYFGEVTRAAVARWQTAMGISPAAGYFGARSRTAMSGGYVAPAATPAAPVVSSNSAIASECIILNNNLYLGEENQNVTRIQRFLVAKGYLIMPAGADYGYYGPSTTQALSKFMASRGLNHQGAVVDAAIRNEIKVVSCQ